MALPSEAGWARHCPRTPASAVPAPAPAHRIPPPSRPPFPRAPPRGSLGGAVRPVVHPSHSSSSLSVGHGNAPPTSETAWRQHPRHAKPVERVRWAILAREVLADGSVRDRPADQALRGSTAIARGRPLP